MTPNMHYGVPDCEREENLLLLLLRSGACCCWVLAMDRAKMFLLRLHSDFFRRRSRIALRPLWDLFFCLDSPTRCVMLLLTRKARSTCCPNRAELISTSLLLSVHSLLPLNVSFMFVYSSSPHMKRCPRNPAETRQWQPQPHPRRS